MGRASSSAIVRTRELWIRDSPIQPNATPTTVSVRSNTDDHGSLSLATRLPAAAKLAAEG